MQSIEFCVPKRVESKQQTYYIELKTEIIIPESLKWSNGELIPDIRIQSTMESYRNRILSELVKNKTFFRTPPTYESIQAITPVWGIIVNSLTHELRWAPDQIIEKSESLTANTTAYVNLQLKGIEISRSTIQPVWIMNVIQVLPDPSHSDGVIDFEFEDVYDDGVKSVGSNEFEEDVTGEPVQLMNHAEKKRIAKDQVRQTLRRLAEARMAADTAMERFYDEYDLSEGESDFSDEEN